MKLFSKLFLSICFILSITSFTQALNINQEGRILPAMVNLTTTAMFDIAPVADQVSAALQVFPTDSAWNEDISNRAVAANSAAVLANMAGNMHNNDDMCFIFVPPTQPTVNVTFNLYPGDSDRFVGDCFNCAGGGTPGAYPVPPDQPCEPWPNPFGVGADSNCLWSGTLSGDHHSITVDPLNMHLFETWQMVRSATDCTGTWTASNGAAWDLTSNQMRCAGMTSGDAAGLPIFPAVIRYDECQRGMVEHAIRITVHTSQKAYVYPAQHQAGSQPPGSNYPRMGERLRLKANFAIPGAWSPAAQAVALALKKYGAIVADNGSNMFYSDAPDPRFVNLSDVNALTQANFDIIQTSAAPAGPRTAGTLTVTADTNQTITVGQQITLHGTLTDTYNNGVALQWCQYGTSPYPYADYSFITPGYVTPTGGVVTWGSPTALSTTVSMNAVGTYILMLKATEKLQPDDGTRLYAFNYAVINVVASVSTPTSTQTPSQTATFVPTSTNTATRTASATASATGTSTQTLTSSQTPTASSTTTQTATYTITLTPSQTLTSSQTSTVTQTGTATNTPTVTATATQTNTATQTPTITQTFTVTMTSTVTMTGTQTYTSTQTSTPSQTQTPSMTFTPSLTFTNTPTFITTPPTIGTSFIYPSPATGDSATIVYLMLGPGTVKIRVYNEAAELVATIEEQKQGGPQASILDVRNFVSGVYLYMVSMKYNSTYTYQGSTKIGPKKFIVLK